MAGEMQRFLAKTAPGENGCVLWTGSRKSTGYGFFSVNGRVVLAHRWIYQQVHGPQAGLVVMHKCDNPPCVNVEHLRVGTQADNVRDAVAKGRNHITPHKTHCKHGHVFTASNTYITKHGTQACRICRDAHRARCIAKHEGAQNLG